MRATIAVTLTAAVIAAALPVHAGQGVNAASHPGNAASEGALVVEDVMQAKKTLMMGESGFLSRLHLVSAALAVRGRTLAFDDARPLAGQVQTAHALRGELRIDHVGRFLIHGGAATGQGLNGGWTTTGVGPSASNYPFFLKQLFVSAALHPRVKLETGGLYIMRGESTEATSYDNDGYIVGERVILARPFGHAIDQMSLTRAYLGDIDQANVLARLRRLNRANYYQLQASRRAAAVSLSMDMTFHSGEQVLRAAAVIPTSRVRVLDLVRFEQYSRLSPNRGAGYAATVQRRVSTGTVIAGGLSNIDRRYGALNGDLYGNGIRAFASARYTIRDGWVASVQGVRRLNDVAPLTPRLRLDVAVAYDLLRIIKTRRSQPRE